MKNPTCRLAASLVGLLGKLTKPPFVYMKVGLESYLEI